MTNTVSIAKTIGSGSNDYGISGYFLIDIPTTKVRSKISSGLQKEIPYPTLPSDTSTAPVNYIIDLRKSQESWEIEGYLDDTAGGATAITKLQRILAMKQAGGTLDTFIYRSLTLTNDAYIYQFYADDIDTESGDITRGGEAKVKVHLEIRRGKVLGT